MKRSLHSALRKPAHSQRLKEVILLFFVNTTATQRSKCAEMSSQTCRIPHFHSLHSAFVRKPQSLELQKGFWDTCSTEPF